MPINFFDPVCQEQPATAVLFGIVDDQNGTKAFIDTANSENWIAIVINPNQIAVVFTAIDNCVEILRPNGDMESRCDGMLTYPGNIVFVELKNQRKNWISDAIDQLETTIRHFFENHDIDRFRRRRAFACNKRHPNFEVLENERMKRFFDESRVRLNVQAEIPI